MPISFHPYLIGLLVRLIQGKLLFNRRHTRIGSPEYQVMVEIDYIFISKELVIIK